MDVVLAKIKAWPLFLLVMICNFSFAEQASLADSPQWRALLHYQTSPYPFSRQQFSQVADSEFFLDKNGKHDPEAELNANLQQLQSNKCRFPARTLWLAKQTGQQITLEDCDELNDWLKQFASDEVYLHFPSNYLNNPSSVFGHTFLRLHKRDRSALLDPIINYAAVSNTQNPAKYIVSGLTGGFPGVFAMHPHYLKKREYTVTENREIWSYKIKLTQEEINRFLLHFWEIKDRQFNYYFLNQNCSYQLMALLDVAISDISLLDEFHNVALPIDTIKFLHNHQRLELANFHPSFIDEFRLHSTTLNNAEKQRVLALTQCPASNVLEEDTGQILRLSSDYLEYLIQQDLRPRKCAHQQMAILQKASKEKSYLPPVFPSPEVAPQDAHPSAKIGVGFQSVSGALLNFRLGYHDLLDSIAGFKPGQEIILGDFAYDIERNKIADYKLIGLKSLSASDEFFQPLSWAFEISGRRYDDELNSALHHQVILGVGKSLQIGRGLAFVLLNTSLSYNRDSNTDVLLTPEFGYLYNGETINSSQTLRIEMPASDWQEKRLVLASKQTVNFTNDVQLSFSAEWLHHDSYQQGNIALSLSYLF
ncbi:Lnb N-terminal periplasmic domain-containing protein [Thalassotalea mangrovi]|uniref:DUF4105 domain-containing protein n=1 Tax=Thalassotalea mangrovi TaxID=2572245 RepID=A0A4U1B6W5_9GAMM|nr:DUF4105 domain-containing protein [Thalassotalea mangrovi]TKB45602.1 DUF4105 domain-containing protein [Thalassotalea mangrovi]